MADSNNLPLLPDINEGIVRHLQETNEIVLVSKVFATLKTNERRVSFIYDLLQERGFLPRLSIDGKSSQASEDYRQKGNEMFKKKKMREAHEFYTKSIAFAPIEGDYLSLAYANRSAVLFEKGLYEGCLSDIERALENNYQGKLMPKILTRQAKAKDLLPRQRKIEYFTPLPSIPEAERNPLIQSAANCVRVEQSEMLGRHIIATINIEPGEIIAIEKPFCHNVIDQQYIHCHHCLKLCYTLTPCLNCTQTLYCGESCRMEAYLAYHQYACPILLSIKRNDLSCRHLHLRVAILARDKYTSLDQCILDKDGVYRSGRYEEIHNLVANTSKRSVADLFNRAVSAAVFYHFLKTSTDFFEGKTKEFEAAFKELMLLHLQIGQCNFYEVSEVKSSDHSFDASDQQEIGESVGEAVYSFSSLFNHSCHPNVARYGYGSTLIAITIRGIKKGEQCLMNYGCHHLTLPKAERKAKLQKRYFFDCACKACTDNYPLYTSLKEIRGPGNWISLRDWKMLQDNNLEEAKKIFKKLRRQIKELQNKEPNRNLAELQEALKRCCDIFSAIRTPI